MKFLASLFIFLFALLGMTQVDSLEIPELHKEPAEIRVHLHWKFGAANLVSSNNEFYKFNGLRGFGVAFEINRWLVSVNLDFRQRNRRKFFQRVYGPQYKLDVNYRIMDLKNHQMYFGVNLGVFSEVEILVPGYTNNSNLRIDVPAVFVGGRLAYRKLGKWHLKHKMSILPELFAEFCTLFSGVVHAAKMSDSSLKPEPAFWGHNFALGIKFSLVKFVKPTEEINNFQFN